MTEFLILATIAALPFWYVSFSIGQYFVAKARMENALADREEGLNRVSYHR